MERDGKGRKVGNGRRRKARFEAKVSETLVTKKAGIGWGVEWTVSAILGPVVVVVS